MTDIRYLGDQQVDEKLSLKVGAFIHRTIEEAIEGIIHVDRFSQEYGEVIVQKILKIVDILWIREGAYTSVEKIESIIKLVNIGTYIHLIFQVSLFLRKSCNYNYPYIWFYFSYCMRMQLCMYSR